MFLDASAVTAILLEEDEGRDFSDRIERARHGGCITSPLAIFETVLSITRRQGGDIPLAWSVVLRFLRGAAVQVVAVDEEVARLSLDAHARFGKGRHPAALNFGDCFAYAMAKQHGVPLLYKGDDFARTDLA